MAQTVTVRIPAALRPQVGDHESIQVGGGTVGAVLGAVCSQYPDFGKRLYKSEGQLNRFINVYLNDEDIRFLDNLDTPVKAGDELSIVPAIAGG
ncbi:MAG TPA: ubiquitin-like small modifier protein 1 [Phycisphaeraceae bacterium]